MRKNLIQYILIIFLLISGTCSRNPGEKSPWPEITNQTKPWTRWWWMGSAVDSGNLTLLLEEYSRAGFGGVEITPIYGTRGYEDRYIDFLSPGWMNMLGITVSEAERTGLEVDMNLGTGWPFGGPQITPDYAASKLILKKYIFPENNLSQKMSDLTELLHVDTATRLEALVAYSENNEFLDLTESVDDHLILDPIPEKGYRELYAAFCGKTGQKVKRAAPGGEGFSMDHFSRSALDTYLNRFDQAFTSSTGIRAFFNDSYEVYHASWSPGFFDEFSRRRGYDLKKYLKYLAGEGDTEVIARVKSDYRQTMSEMLLENFTVPWTDWAHKQRALTRNQAHGSPGNLIDLYAAVDIPECEVFGHRNFDIPGLPVNDDDTRNVEPNPMMLKLATSAAHIVDKPLLSNETFTWLGEHFKVALSQCKPEVEEAFLAGINHVFYHGTTYSPADAPWPGWLFYASVNFSPGNSSWSHLPGLNQYITRCQSILQSGKPDNEILVYWPVFDIWHDPDGLEKQIDVHNIREWLVYPGVENMEKAGHSFDFISDALLQQVEPADGRLITGGGKATYDALVIPQCKFMPLETLEKITDLAKAGCTVIFRNLPQDVPGIPDLEMKRDKLKNIYAALPLNDPGDGIQICNTGEGAIMVSDDIDKALTKAGLRGEEIPRYGLKFNRRSLDDGKYYFLVNHTPSPVDEMIPLNAKAVSVLMLDPQKGRHGLAEIKQDNENILVRVQLEPGEAIFLRTFNDRNYNADDWIYREKQEEPFEIQSPWELEFKSGGPVLPQKQEMDRLAPWTDFQDSLMLIFSGTAIYSTNFIMDELSADQYILDLGEVFHSARVWLNGWDTGILWSVPFKIEIGSFLRKGKNTLSIEVSNLMANRIRYMDRQGIKWKIFHEINFVNIEYQPFDASGWDIMPSGLSGPVSIIPYHTSPGIPVK